MFCLFYFRFAGHYPQKICINEMQVHGATLWVLPLCVLARFLPAHAAAEAWAFRIQDSELRLRAKAAFSQDAAVCRCAVTCHAFKRHRKSFCSCASTMTFPPMSNWLTGDARRSFSCPTKTPCPTQWALNCQQSSSVNAKFIFKIK